jgi:hypothetical protein
VKAVRVLRESRVRTGRAIRATLGLAVLALSLPLAAAWELDNERSVVNFVTVKNTNIAELHYFKSVAGVIGDDGSAQLTIDLDSVETLVPIRNQRMRELLFETVRFPSAVLTTQVPDTLSQLAAGESASGGIKLTLELHGSSKTYDATVTVTHTIDGSLRVTLLGPLIVQAADFELAAGVMVLQEVAGLSSITTAVPISAHLVFTPVED